MRQKYELTGEDFSLTEDQKRALGPNNADSNGRTLMMDSYGADPFERYVILVEGKADPEQIRDLVDQNFTPTKFVYEH